MSTSTDNRKGITIEIPVEPEFEGHDIETINKTYNVETFNEISGDTFFGENTREGLTSLYEENKFLILPEDQISGELSREELEIIEKETREILKNFDIDYGNRAYNDVKRADLNNYLTQNGLTINKIPNENYEGFINDRENYAKEISDYNKEMSDYNALMTYINENGHLDDENNRVTFDAPEEPESIPNDIEMFSKTNDIAFFGGDDLNSWGEAREENKYIIWPDDETANKALKGELSAVELEVIEKQTLDVLREFNPNYDEQCWTEDMQSSFNEYLETNGLSVSKISNEDYEVMCDNGDAYAKEMSEYNSVMAYIEDNGLDVDTDIDLTIEEKARSLAEKDFDHLKPERPTFDFALEDYKFNANAGIGEDASARDSMFNSKDEWDEARRNTTFIVFPPNTDSEILERAKNNELSVDELNEYAQKGKDFMKEKNPDFYTGSWDEKETNGLTDAIAEYEANGGFICAIPNDKFSEMKNATKDYEKNEEKYNIKLEDRTNKYIEELSPAADENTHDDVQSELLGMSAENFDKFMKWLEGSHVFQTAIEKYVSENSGLTNQTVTDRKDIEQNDGAGDNVIEVISDAENVPTGYLTSDEARKIFDEKINNGEYMKQLGDGETWHDVFIREQTQNILDKTGQNELTDEQDEAIKESLASLKEATNEIYGKQSLSEESISSAFKRFDNKTSLQIDKNLEKDALKGKNDVQLD